MGMCADSGRDSFVEVQFCLFYSDTYTRYLIQHMQHRLTVRCDEAVPVPAAEQGRVAVSYFIAYLCCHLRVISGYPYFNYITVGDVDCNYIFSFLPQNISLTDTFRQDSVIQTDAYLGAVPCCLTMDFFEGFMPLNVYIVDFFVPDTGILYVT